MQDNNLLKIKKILCGIKIQVTTLGCYTVFPFTNQNYMQDVFKLLVLHFHHNHFFILVLSFLFIYSYFLRTLYKSKVSIFFQSNLFTFQPHSAVFLYLFLFFCKLRFNFSSRFYPRNYFLAFKSVLFLSPSTTF